MLKPITLKQFIEQFNEQANQKPELLDCDFYTVGGDSRGYIYISVKDKDGERKDIYIRDRQ